MMQFTVHATRRTPHGASRLVLAMSAWLVKTQRAPSRHSRNARVYGHTTTAMHKLSTPPSPSPGSTCITYNFGVICTGHRSSAAEARGMFFAPVRANMFSKGRRY